MSKILIIDDEKSIRSSLKEILEYEKHEVMEAENGSQGIEMTSQHKFDLVFCDIKMPGMDGMEVLEKLQETGIEAPMVMISGHGTIETAVEAIRKGAYDFIQKPLDLNRILVTLRNATQQSELLKESKILKRKIAKNLTGQIIGESPAIKHIKQMIETVAPTEARVLITGENGSGKELVARQLHDKSPRSNGPFIEVNCAAIPAELIESELFGHEKGAFTSAIKLRKGRFEQAQGGTLFLDEIGDMTLSAQAKVLRALQENKITRVGADKDINVDVRIVAATNKNLQQAIEAGQFREDLFHRLSVILIHVPSLNERSSDVPLLANHFMTLICQEYGNKPKAFKKDALEALQKINWTGNIRELRNIIERLIILCPSEISAEDVDKFSNPKTHS